MAEHAADSGTDVIPALQQTGDQPDANAVDRPAAATRPPRKAEDTSEGCHAMAASDRERASQNVNERMKAVFERSASAWSSRGDMFKRLEAQRESKNNG